MTAPAEWIKLRMVSGPDTAPADLVWNGTVVVVLSDYPIGSGEGSPGVLLGVRGFTRPAAGDPPLEFVMTSLITPATVQTVNQIPGAQEWTDLAQRQVFYNVGRAMVNLIEANRPPSVAETVQVLTLLFGAAKAEVLAEIAAGRITVPPQSPTSTPI